MRKMIDKVVSGHETTSIDLSDKIALIDADKLKYIVTNKIKIGVHVSSYIV